MDLTKLNGAWETALTQTTKSAVVARRAFWNVIVVAIRRAATNSKAAVLIHSIQALLATHTIGMSLTSNMTNAP